MLLENFPIGCAEIILDRDRKLSYPVTGAIVACHVNEARAEIRFGIIRGFSWFVDEPTQQTRFARESAVENERRIVTLRGHRQKHGQCGHLILCHESAAFEAFFPQERSYDMMIEVRRTFEARCLISWGQLCSSVWPVNCLPHLSLLALIG